ncbi:MAG: DUF512 domain-containing protein [Acutalibacteraceae bacterium]
MAVKIMSVTHGSPADRNGILPGETLISINSNIIIDVLDYRFYQTDRQTLLVICDEKGSEREVLIRKREYEELGLEFETYLMDKQHSCKNKCIFCFIDQLPKGMRKSLYFKDDDSRLSFLFGNYITLTNLSEHEIERIIKMHISPINVSVHTTNPELRVKMMKNKNAGKALSILKRFADAGIKINCQIVSCPGINNGDELKRTLNDLTRLYPSVESIAVVPVGLTRFRDGLYPLTPYTKQTALETLSIIEDFGDECIKSFGARLVYAADELYIKAGKSIPRADFYGDFDQLENGVGLLALLKEEFEFYLDELKADEKLKRKVTVASGESSAPFLSELFFELFDKFPGVQVQTVPIKNNFFGGGVNVSGLVTGKDLIEQLKGRDLGECLIIPSVMLRREGDIFLDDTSVEDVKKELNIKLTAVNNSGEELIDAILGKH